MKPSGVTSEQFKVWRIGCGLSQAAAARYLGLSHSSIHTYESGKRAEGEVKIPLLVALGMSAISAGLTPYKGEKDNADSIQDSF